MLLPTKCRQSGEENATCMNKEMLLLLLLADACKSGLVRSPLMRSCEKPCADESAAHFGYLKLAGRLVGNTLIANDSAAACPPDPFHRILILAHLSLIEQSALFLTGN